MTFVEFLAKNVGKKKSVPLRNHYLTKWTSTRPHPDCGPSDAQRAKALEMWDDAISRGVTLTDDEIIAALKEMER